MESKIPKHLIFWYGESRRLHRAPVTVRLVLYPEPLGCKDDVSERIYPRQPRRWNRAKIWQFDPRCCISMVMVSWSVIRDTLGCPALSSKLPWKLIHNKKNGPAEIFQFSRIGIAVVLWSIWTIRNKLIFEKKILKILWCHISYPILLTTMESALEYQNAGILGLGGEGM